MKATYKNLKVLNERYADLKNRIAQHCENHANKPTDESKAMLSQLQHELEETEPKLRAALQVVMDELSPIQLEILRLSGELCKKSEKEFKQYVESISSGTGRANSFSDFAKVANRAAEIEAKGLKRMVGNEKMESYLDEKAKFKAGIIEVSEMANRAMEEAERAPANLESLGNEG